MQQTVDVDARMQQITGAAECLPAYGLSFSLYAVADLAADVPAATVDATAVYGLSYFFFAAAAEMVQHSAADADVAAN